MLRTQVIGRKKSAAGLAACGLTLLYVGTALAGPKGAVGDLYVCDNEVPGKIVQIDSSTGVIVGDFVTGLVEPIDARFGPNGDLYIVDYARGTVNQYDGNTGVLTGNVISGLTAPTGLRFEANGNLLIYEAGTGSIKEFDTTGSFLGVFASGFGNTFYITPLDFGPDGDLYVSGSSPNFIRRFGPDGTDKGTFATGSRSWSVAEGHTFGPNGNLFVSDYQTNTVAEFDGVTGAFIGDFISTNLNSPAGIAFGPDGNVWVGSIYGANGNHVDEYDGTTGDWIQEVNGPGLGYNGGIRAVTVKPASGPTDCLAMTVSALTAGQTASWDVSGATAGSVVAVVYGLQAGSTVVTDQMGFCATFGIKGVSQNSLVGTAAADGSGNASITKMIPAIASGLTVLTQAAEQGTCPNECVSNLDLQVVQ